MAPRILQHFPIEPLIHTMPYDTLITAEQLMGLRDSGQPLVLLDCGFDLANPATGEREYNAGHLPGAHFAHLDRDLCSAMTGRNGRHPMPTREALARRAGHWGIRPGVQVVAYDDQGMPFAAHAWWLLRWLGHAPVAVLDGGRSAWVAAGGALTPEWPSPGGLPPYPAQPPGMPTLDADTLLARLPEVQAGSLVLVDGRAAERWRGEVEPLDPVAGRIPGARQRFFKDNLEPDGRFKPPAVLHAVFSALGAAAPQTVQQCGSGVTACQNVLAMVHAGLGVCTLYPGGWSEWCADPSRPVARG